MKKRKRKLVKRATTVRKTAVKRTNPKREQLAQFLDTIAPYLVERLTQAEMDCAHYQQELKQLQGRLASMLSPDQKEAAVVCGVSPELYAIECIELYKEKFFPQMPIKLRPLAELKSGLF